MRRAIVLLAGLVALVLVTSSAFAGGDDDGGDYLVRAYFDNGSFTVAGQDVRVGGANVGVIEDVDVALPGEKVSNEPGQEVRPGTALVVLKIEDPGYQDFREDASCILRPQSLIGERFVDCTTTEPRADSSEAPPELEFIEDGPGEGQYLLPLENNGRTVDIDLLNNVYREPFRDRFRLILNELGAGLATRGDDLAEIIERADPTLREGNEVLEKLADQRKTLARLTQESDQILEPLSRARGDVTGFIRNAAVPAGVTAERRAQLEEALARFPTFLRELRSTMTEFDDFTGAAVPVLDDLGVAAPDITRATQALDPFSKLSTTALKSLGRAGEKAGPLFAEANPVVRKASKLATTGTAPTRNLDKFLLATKTTDGFDYLMQLIYNTGASINGFDEYGTYLRTYLLPDNCVDYENEATLNCSGTFVKPDFFSAPARDQGPTVVGAALEDVLGGPIGRDDDQTAESPGEDPEAEAPAQEGQAPSLDPDSPDSVLPELEPPAAGARGQGRQRDRGGSSAFDDLYAYLLEP